MGTPGRERSRGAGGQGGEEGGEGRRLHGAPGTPAGPGTSPAGFVCGAAPCCCWGSARRSCTGATAAAAAAAAAPAPGAAAPPCAPAGSEGALRPPAGAPPAGTPAAAAAAPPGGTAAALEAAAAAAGMPEPASARRIAATSALFGTSFRQLVSVVLTLPAGPRGTGGGEPASQQPRQPAAPPAAAGAAVATRGALEPGWAPLSRRRTVAVCIDPCEAGGPGLLAAHHLRFGSGARGRGVVAEARQAAMQALPCALAGFSQHAPHGSASAAAPVGQRSSQAGTARWPRRTLRQIVTMAWVEVAAVTRITTSSVSHTHGGLVALVHPALSTHHGGGGGGSRGLSAVPFGCAVWQPLCAGGGGQALEPGSARRLLAARGRTRQPPLATAASRRPAAGRSLRSATRSGRGSGAALTAERCLVGGELGVVGVLDVGGVDVHPLAEVGLQLLQEEGVGWDARGWGGRAAGAYHAAGACRRRLAVVCRSRQPPSAPTGDGQLQPTQAQERSARAGGKRSGRRRAGAPCPRAPPQRRGCASGQKGGAQGGAHRGVGGVGRAVAVADEDGLLDGL